MHDHDPRPHHHPLMIKPWRLTAPMIARPALSSDAGQFGADRLLLLLGRAPSSYARRAGRRIARWRTSPIDTCSVSTTSSSRPALQLEPELWASVLLLCVERGASAVACLVVRFRQVLEAELGPVSVGLCCAVRWRRINQRLRRDEVPGPTLSIRDRVPTPIADVPPDGVSLASWPRGLPVALLAPRGGRGARNPRAFSG